MGFDFPRAFGWLVRMSGERAASDSWEGLASAGFLPGALQARHGAGLTGQGRDGRPLARERVTYESGGLKISALLSKPPGLGPFPLVLVNHGGFDPAERVGKFLDLFVAQGWVALASDYRGCGQSEGRREVARGEVDDVLNAAEYAKTLGYVDGRRVAVWGFSHGGEIALLAASRSPGIKAVVAVQGPVELADCYRSWTGSLDESGIRPLVGIALHVGGTPEQVPEAWKERSPLYAASRITCPVLLIYSDQDDCIPPDQGPRMERALRDTGNPAAQLILVRGANHGLDSNSWSEVLPATVDFLRQRLG